MKTSKLNQFVAIFIALFMTLAVSSCSSDDDDDKKFDVPQELIGTWNLYGMQYTFNADGTGYISGDFDDEDMSARTVSGLSSRSGRMTLKFTYTYNASEHSVVINCMGEKERWQIVELSDGLLVIIDSEGERMTLVKEGAVDPSVPDTDYAPCPLSTLIGDWGVAGRAMYGFNSEGYMKWFMADGEHFEPGTYSYDAEKGILDTSEGGSVSVRKVTDDIIMLWDNSEAVKAPFLLTRIIKEPFTVGDISLLYDKTWTMVGIATLDNRPAYPWTYYFDSKGIWSSSVQGSAMGGSFRYESSTKTLVLNMMDDDMEYKVISLTSDKVVLSVDSRMMEMVVMPGK